MSRIDDEALSWVAKQSAAPLCDVDRRAFDAWYAASPRHQGAYLRAQAIWHSLDKAAIQPNLRPAEMSSPRGRPASRRAFLAGGVAAAGVAAAAVAVSGLITSRKTILKTVTGEFRKVPLADRSIANLNSGSHVEVDVTPHSRRVVLVAGEAWFEVAKDPDKPFVVEAGDVRVQAIGTAFSVRRRDNGADVMVTEGVVEAWSNGGTAGRQRIAAGGEAFIARAAQAIEVSHTPDEIERKLAWRDGNIVLNNETLAEATEDFNRYNARKIIIADPALRHMRFVGQYRIDQPESFADAVHSLLDVPVVTTSDGIFIGASGQGSPAPTS